MSPNIELDDIVKKKLDYFKENSGSKTFSDAINYLLLQSEQIRLLKENQKYLRENQEYIVQIRDFIRDSREILLEIKDLEHKKMKK